MTLATTLALAAAQAEPHGNVQAQTFIFGLIAFIVFLALDWSRCPTATWRTVTRTRPRPTPRRTPSTRRRWDTATTRTPA